MRLRKLLVSTLFATILVIQCVGLGWSVSEGDKENVVVYALYVAFALYTLSLSGASINQTYSRHSNALVHLSGLTFVAVLLLGTTAILPSKPPPAVSIFRHESGAPHGLWYATLALYAVCLFMAATTPRGPPLHFPSAEIYSDKTLMQITSKYEDNVCGITGTLVISNAMSIRAAVRGIWSTVAILELQDSCGHSCMYSPLACDNCHIQYECTVART